jgi:hypothetical protein
MRSVEGRRPMWKSLVLAAACLGFGATWAQAASLYGTRFPVRT